MNGKLIPFFVADRPASLYILKGIMLKYPDIKVGIMTHAFTTKNVQMMFKSFPYNIPFKYENSNLLRNELTLYENLVKMTDSGIFSKNGCIIDYKELYERYNYMGTHYGIMIDVLRDTKATLKSAEKALIIFERNKKKYKFNLVAVAQGDCLEEYLNCYSKLFKKFEFIAIGGLLKKIKNSARYVRVRDEKFLFSILEVIKKEFNPDWLFALGCYHPKRHKKFEEIGVWGSDYKGWIFNYKQKNKFINSYESENTIYVEKEEQELRFHQVRDYIERNIYGQIR